MIVLACESSTLLGSVAVVENGQVLAVEESMRQGSHSDVLNVFIERALLKSKKKLTDIDVFASSVGPGSFTGIRISVNTIKTLAYCHSKPVCCTSSLASLAMATKNSASFKEFSNKPIVSMINAYKNMCYVATYSWQNGVFTEVKSPEVVRVQNLENYCVEDSVVCGDGFSTYQKFFQHSLLEKMIRISDISDEPNALTLALGVGQLQLQQMAWNELLPLYLRASEAEENLMGIKFQPLF